ncbi:MULTISPECIES: hypothetical protein [unclassified Clostridium]|uniref:hypothetical protein n=1 Tax=unclassified Clostridium TaxID=2614128 RepID=UPI000298680B|nr:MULTISPECIES: hypothetical protein [unclassified Clostridium]EKQ56595.1 MAG: hypothetical protein A370_01665 [Clostridium sp. Maddingley MBC34-26]
MKKLIMFLLITLYISFNMIINSPLAQVSGVKEGLYKASDLNISEDKTYTIQNTSANDSVYVLIFNENNVVQQSLRIEPKSPKYNLSPLKPEYRIVIVGNGDVSIS